MNFVFYNVIFGNITPLPDNISAGAHSRCGEKKTRRLRQTPRGWRLKSKNKIHVDRVHTARYSVHYNVDGTMFTAIGMRDLNYTNSTDDRVHYIAIILCSDPFEIRFTTNSRAVGIITLLYYLVSESYFSSRTS